MRIRELGSAFNFFRSGIWLTVGDVLRNRAMKERSFLWYIGDVLAQGNLLHLADVLTINQDFTFTDISETKQELRKCSLAGARHAD